MTLPPFGLQIALCRVSKRHQTQAIIQASLYNAEGAQRAAQLTARLLAFSRRPHTHDVRALTTYEPTAARFTPPEGAMSVATRSATRELRSCSRTKSLSACMSML